MLSGRKRSRPDAPPIFFLDRGIGRYIVADALRQAGFEVVLMAAIYPDGTDERVDDPTWIARASSENWVALTKDPSIVRAHEDALRASSLRVFAFNNAHLTGEVMAQRVVSNLQRIVQRSRQPGPFVYVISVDGLERRWPRG